MEILFTCTHCKKIVTAKKYQVDEVGTCPHCKKEIKAPPKSTIMRCRLCGGSGTVLKDIPQDAVQTVVLRRPPTKITMSCNSCGGHGYLNVRKSKW